MMASFSSSVNDFSCAPTYSDGIGEPLAVREVGAEHDRLDPDLGDDALHVLLGEGRDHEVVAEDLARALGRASRPLRLAAHEERVVHLAQRVRQPHRALLREAHAHVREATEEVVQDHARR